ncbi:transglycosylase SLT domain-containing protein [bacterium]|nr:transglycosylase SLT domain-containing protein [candidate division CSSED10-310 bacterium]
MKNYRSTCLMCLFMMFCLPGASCIFIPENLTFCGEPLPTEGTDVRERLETQLRLLARNTGQIELWIKRKHRYFPVIDPLLRESKVPPDLKYIPVIESSLRTSAVSSKSAVGPWQFIAETGRNNGLCINRWIDERRDIRSSTEAAVRYLKFLHDEFGSWPTALAAYNIGENRMVRETYQQGTGCYYEMILPEETDRYVFNAISAKIILEYPGEFGIDPAETVPFDDPETTPVSLILSGSLPVKIIAHAAGISIREFRLINPWCIGDELPEGRYSVHLDTWNRAGFEGGIEKYRRLIQNMVMFRNRLEVTVKADRGEMRIGPDADYPVFRILTKDTAFRVTGRTADRDRGEYWYRFIKSGDMDGWIWGGQIKH